MPHKRPALADLSRGLLLLLMTACVDTRQLCAAEAAVWPIPDWQVSTPEEQGMDSAELAKVIAYGKTKSFDSLLITRHGRIVLDAYYAPYTGDIPHNLNSATKSVVSSLIAMLRKDALLDSFEQPVLDIFADREVANVDERKKAITVQHLLDMTSGLEWDEGFEGGREQSMIDMRRSPDWVKFILDRPMSSHAPGELFYYNSGNSHLLSAIVTKLAGTATVSYANMKLLGPLGIAPPFWRRDPQGIAIGGFGLSLRPHDMAKFGYLYLRRGEWAGQQLLPAEWVDSVSHATIRMNARADASLTYHNQFWALPDQHVFMAVGYHCQVIMIFPDLDIVAAMTARDFCSFRRMAEGIAGAVKSEAPLPTNPDSTRLLDDAVSDVSTEKPTAVGPMPEIASAISGKTFRFASNALDVRSFSLSFTDSPSYAVELETHNPANPVIRIRGPMGLDGLYRKSEPTSFGLRAVKGSWVNGDTFAVDVQYVGLGEQQTFSLSFSGDNEAVLRGKTRGGREVKIDGQAGG
ncbi:serine hydrolase [Bradyrhizobium sp. 179]|uniref:serine hydrolase domain-containing protein n=1 Tax=Bradyrhizobium sp. 179 TaxID=2782648 RepID=UPI001FFC1881|nr:serine hydrolase [Bradyrhizobium sp. 179]MCK1544820.1 serine hydrolase [Bradyrhizobium sp. 179]